MKRAVSAASIFDFERVDFGERNRSFHTEARQITNPTPEAKTPDSPQGG